MISPLESSVFPYALVEILASIKMHNEPNTEQQGNSPEYPIRGDIDAVLRQIDQENQSVQGELARVKLRYEQQMIKILIEKGSRKMLEPLIQKLKEMEVDCSKQRQEWQSACDRLSQENRVLKAQLSIIHYELAQGDVDPERLLELLEAKFTDELIDFVAIVRQARVIASRHRNGRNPSKPDVRHLASLVQEFDQKYPHFRGGSN